MHAAALAAHPDAELVGVWGRDLAKAKAVGAEFDVAGYADLDALLADVDAVSIALPPDVQVAAGRARRRGGKHLLLEKPIALDRRRRRPGGRRGARRPASPRSCSSRARFRPATSSWLRAGGADRRWPAGRDLAGRQLAPGQPVRRLALAQASTGALWDIGPHALSLLVPALGPVVSVQAGAGLRDTVHLVLQHESGAAQHGDALAHRGARCRPASSSSCTATPAGSCCCPRSGAADRGLHQVAVDELTGRRADRRHAPLRRRLRPGRRGRAGDGQRALTSGARSRSPAEAVGLSRRGS